MGGDLSTTWTKNPSDSLWIKDYRKSQPEEETYVWPRIKDDPLYYRRYDGRPQPDSLSIWIKNPFSDIYDNTMNLQVSQICGKIELGMFNCLEAYGLPLGYERCRDHMDDFMECTSEKKRYSRVKIMRRERARQWRQGEREIKYAPPPKAGSYML